MTRSREQIPPRSAAPAAEGLEPRFERLFERYVRPVNYFFARRGFSQEECRELTQDTFLGAYKGMERFRSDASVETWLFTIAGNVWRNEVRRRSSEMRDGHEVSLDQLLDEGQDVQRDPFRPAADPLTATLANERREKLHEALGELPDQMRRCLLLRIDQELKYREIAAVMQISINTVKSQLYQAREKLQAKLSELADPGVGQKDRADKEA